MEIRSLLPDFLHFLPCGQNLEQKLEYSPGDPRKMQRHFGVWSGFGRIRSGRALVREMPGSKILGTEWIHKLRRGWIIETINRF